MPPKIPLIIAHQGESFDAPENTMAAFDLAWQRGDAAIEFDVHVTSDGHVILSHDDNTRRTTGELSNLIIKNTSLKDLQALDVGKWKHPQFAGEKMPLLSDVLKKMPPDKIAFIEIKPSVENPRIVFDVMKQSSHRDHEMRMMSFKDAIVAEFKSFWPAGPEAYLLAHFSKNKETRQWTPDVEELISRARACKADGLDLQNAEPFNTALVQKIHAANLQCYVWTEDEAEPARRYMNMGVDGITTNRAQWIGRQLGKPG